MKINKSTGNDNSEYLCTSTVGRSGKQKIQH